MFTISIEGKEWNFNTTFPLNSTLNCDVSSDDSCHVVCDGNQSCSGAIINCGSTSQCLIDCTNGDSCDGAQFHGENAEYFEINLYIDWSTVDSSYGSLPCATNSEIYCPVNPDTKNCKIHCDTGGYSAACDNVTIWAVEGFNDIIIEDFSPKRMLRYSIIRMGEQYEYKCKYNWKLAFEQREFYNFSSCIKYNITTTISSLYTTTNNETITPSTTNDDQTSIKQGWINSKDAIWIVFGCISCGIVLFGLSFGYQRLVIVTEFDIPKHFVIFRFFQNVADFWSDLFFAILLCFEMHFILFILSCCFVVVPFLMQCCIAVYVTLKWKNYQENNPTRLHMYVKRYEMFIYLGTIIGGFYNTVDILQSKIFYKQLFNIPLQSDEYHLLRKFRFINVVLLENVPQFVLQMIYLVCFNKNKTESSTVVLISMTLTVLSIAFSTVREVSRLIHKGKCVGNKSGNNTHESILTGYLTINCNDLNKKHCFCHNRIRSCLTSVFESCHNRELFSNRGDFLYDIEIYFIQDLIHTLHQINVHFLIKMKYFSSATTGAATHDNTKSGGGDNININICNNDEIDVKPNKFCQNMESIGIPGSSNNTAFNSMIESSLKLQSSVTVGIFDLQMQTMNISSPQVTLKPITSTTNSRLVNSKTYHGSTSAIGTNSNTTTGNNSDADTIRSTAMTATTPQTAAACTRVTSVAESIACIALAAPVAPVTGSENKINDEVESVHESKTDEGEEGNTFNTEIEYSFTESRENIEGKHTGTGNANIVININHDSSVVGCSSNINTK